MKLNDYFQEHIMKPLGISHATMFPTQEMRENIAYMHQRDTSGNLNERNHLYRRAFGATTKEEQDRFFHSGGAGLFARPRDYLSKHLPFICYTCELILTVDCRDPRRPG